MGIGHEKLTFKYQGRNFRLTNFHGELSDKVLASPNDVKVILCIGDTCS